MFKTLKISATAILMATASVGMADMNGLSDFRALSAVEVAETEITATMTAVEVADADSVARGVLQVGDKIAFEIGGIEGAKVYILNMDSEGTIQMIYPNKFVTGGEAQEAATMMVPMQDDRYQFEVSGAGGTEVVKVIAIDGDNTAFEELLSSLFDKSAFPRAIQPGEQTTQSLSDFFASGNASIREATLEYVIAK